MTPRSCDPLKSHAKGDVEHGNIVIGVIAASDFLDRKKRLLQLHFHMVGQETLLS